MTFDQMKEAVRNTEEVDNIRLQRLICDFEPDHPDQMLEVVGVIREFRPNYFKQ